MDPLENNSINEFSINDFISETSSSSLYPTIDLVAMDDSQDPPILPRIGDNFQVAIPPMEDVCFDSKFPQKSNHVRGADLDDCSFRVGLTVPVYWVPIQKQDGESRNSLVQGSRDGFCEAEFTCSRNWEFSSDGSWSKSPSDDQLGSLPKARIKNEILDEVFDNAKTSPIGTFQWQHMKSRKYTPLPGRVCTSWTDFDMDSFQLGLYIFGKNLSLVKKFIDAKGMGEILSFYYGQFYQSDAYRRWEECRKTKSKKCILGQRIFTGWRQQELLSRLLPRLSEESKNALFEATRSFTEGTFLFEEYVFKLCSMVGIKALVEAVAIGKGKRDLTGIALDPAKTAVVPSCYPDVPTGKACSALTSAEIVSFLTGGYRLSKTRSNDLFWEAVWPRLLARGWHSEQPKNQQCRNSRPTLVFLVPGVKKFSRKLLKGNHYYDSVADVLNKVASDPMLLKLENEVCVGFNEENACVMSTKVDQNGVMEHKSSSNCCSDAPCSSSELMKFTIVDTSLVQGEAPYKVTDLRTLPIESSYKYSNLSLTHDSSSSSHEEDSDSDSSSDDQKDHADKSLDDHANVQSKFDSKTSDKKLNLVFKDTSLQASLLNHILTVPKKRQVHKQTSENDHRTILHELPAKDICSKPTHKIKPIKPVYLSPVSKRPRLTVCKTVAIGGDCSSSREHHLLKVPIFRCSNGSIAVGPESRQRSGKTTVSSSSKDSLSGSSDNAFRFNCLDDCNASKTLLSDDKSQPKVLIDLNVPPDIDANEICSVQASHGQHDSNRNDNIPSGITQSHEQAFEWSKYLDFEQPSTSLRRQGTRNRPPTTRVLESLESGFFVPRRRPPITKSSHPAVKAPRRRKIIKTPQSLDITNHDDISSELVDMKDEDLDDNNISMHIADSSCVGSSDIVLEHSRVKYNSLDEPQTVGHKSPMKDQS